MKTQIRHAHFAGSLVMVGFGSIGQAMLPVLLTDLGLRPERIRIISASGDGAAIAHRFDLPLTIALLTEENVDDVLDPVLGEGDFLLNLSVDVSSAALIALCQRRGALYLDTCIEPWAGGYLDASLPAAQRSNYALREEVLALRNASPGGPTAIVTQGANPGLASMFVKQALLNIARASDIAIDHRSSHLEWARLAQQLGIRVIHIAERDTQVSARRKQRDEFINTWSVDGFVGEGMQPSELGWGSHERHWPEDGVRHDFGCGAAIYLDRPGAATRVRSWTPLEGPYHGFLITHGESISIADHLTIRHRDEVHYRPTVHYAYHPCDDAVLSLHELAGRNWHMQTRKHIIRDDIVSGMDELGVLLMGHPKGVYWYGSRLSIDEARRIAPCNNATSMQVVAGVLGGMVWALRNPRAGIVEPDDIDYRIVLEIARPYLGELAGVWNAWNPLQERNALFSEDVDRSDPWQFKNFRVS